jgi:ferritin-like metal-binding protein YciE
VAEPNVRDAKIIQYLNEAYGTERKLETALQAHIAMTERDAYKKRLKAHLKETKQHARDVKARIKKLGGSAEEIDLPGPAVVAGAATKVTAAANKAAALAQGPLHALRGTSEPEKELRNAKTEFASEAEEIALYTAIQTLAEAVGDKDTAKLAKTIRRDEERMQKFLGKLIPQLTKAVAQEEIPAAERKTSTSRRSSSSRSSSSRSGSGSSSRSTSRTSASKSGSGSSSRSSASKSGSGSSSARKSSSSTRKSASSGSGSGSSSSRSRAKKS